MEEGEVLAERLRVAFALFGDGVEIMRQNLRRRYPRESDEQISDRLAAWLRHRPGAEHGDGAGRPCPRAEHGDGGRPPAPPGVTGLEQDLRARLERFLSGRTSG